MRVICAQELFPTRTQASIYLAGPSPREASHANWRIEALAIFERLGFTGDVYIPLPRDGAVPHDYLTQANWEQDAMDRADVIAFWVPRELQTLPAFTTNVEFGQKVTGPNVVFGPPDAPKNRFLAYLAERHCVPCLNTLEEVLRAAVAMVGTGAERTGGECAVPLYLWKTPSFAVWYASQKAAGNRLDGCKVTFTFRVGPHKSIVLFWGAHVNVFVASEQRNKTNEIVIGRPDIKHTVGYVPSLDGDWKKVKVILVREFRSPARTADGFIREIPGGSGFKPVRPEVDAANEFKEETGIPVAPDRLRLHEPRQLAGTTTAHCAHLFSVQLTQEELARAMQLQEEKAAQGNIDETERTYVEVCTVEDLLASPCIDWTNLGMILSVVTQL